MTPYHFQHSGDPRMSIHAPSIRGHLILRLDDGHEIDLGRVELPVRVELGPQGPALRGPGASDVAASIRAALNGEIR